jgi:predicted nucleotidyltransferase component of viral defense system
MHGVKACCFDKTWIISKSKSLLCDPVLLEKTVHAFALLGFLAGLKEDFVFKGGTSILLHVPEIKRLSIDIDIVFGGSADEFKSKLSLIAEKKPFIKFEEDNRGERGLPNRRHFKFFYNSSLIGNEQYVLLDIILENPSYISCLAEKTINTPFLEISKKQVVKVLTVEGLLGDKLTAFAPHTIGVPFQTARGINMSMQVAKQLFDIGELFDAVDNFNKVKKAFSETYLKENSYHSNSFSADQVLQDTIDLSSMLCSIGLKGFMNTPDADKIRDGIKRLDSHIAGKQFRLDVEAKVSASKVFCIANNIKNNKTLNIKDKYSADKIELVQSIVLPAPYERLNRLKPILPEVFYYIWLGLMK